jgi:hypothetical protein
MAGVPGLPRRPRTGAVRCLLPCWINRSYGAVDRQEGFVGAQQQKCILNTKRGEIANSAAKCHPNRLEIQFQSEPIENSTSLRSGATKAGLDQRFRSFWMRAIARDLPEQKLRRRATYVAVLIRVFFRQ